MASTGEPSCMVWSSFQNLAAYQLVVEGGSLAGGTGETSPLSERAHQLLTQLGPTYRHSSPTSAGHFPLITIASGTVGAVIDRLRPLSWLVHGLIGVTEAWRFKSEDGHSLDKLIATRVLELACGLRFGIVEIQAPPRTDVGVFNTLVAAAETNCIEQKVDRRGITRHGFPALWPDRFRTLVHISDPACPYCSHMAVMVVEQHGQEQQPSKPSPQLSYEQCESCQRHFFRETIHLVGGRMIEGPIV